MPAWTGTQKKKRLPQDVSALVDGVDEVRHVRAGSAGNEKDRRFHAFWLITAPLPRQRQASPEALWRMVRICRAVRPHLATADITAKDMGRTHIVRYCGAMIGTKAGSDKLKISARHEVANARRLRIPRV